MKRLALVALFVAACTASPVPTLAGLLSTSVSIDDRQMVVAVADTPEARSRGLMGLTDLGGVDGMLFLFEADTESGFWMKDTLIPLDIAFFADDGTFVDMLTMEPCTTGDCPTYHAGGPYRYAVEAPADELQFVGADSVLTTLSE